MSLNKAVTRLVLAGAVALALSACGGSSDEADSAPMRDNAPGYCRPLADLPKDLRAAVRNALVGDASTDDQQVIDRVAAQLETAAKHDSVPPDLGKTLRLAKGALDKLQNHKNVSDNESDAFDSLGKKVATSCIE